MAEPRNRLRKQRRQSMPSHTHNSTGYTEVGSICSSLSGQPKLEEFLISGVHEATEPSTAMQSSASLPRKPLLGTTGTPPSPRLEKTIPERPFLFRMPFSFPFQFSLPFSTSASASAQVAPLPRQQSCHTNGEFPSISTGYRYVRFPGGKALCRVLKKKTYDGMIPPP